jgi:hypothetical protein
MHTSHSTEVLENRSLPAHQRMILYLLPKVGDAVWVGLLLFVLQIGKKVMNADGDLGRHLAIGFHILDNREIPSTDLFSHTMFGEQFIPHEWLSEVAFALFYRWMGFPGVILLCGLLIATTFWLVYRNAQNASGSLVVPVVVTMLAVFASLLHWLSRPHLFTFLLMALWVYELEKVRSHSGPGLYRRWWIFPVSMVLWVNVHGAFVAGLVTWALFGAGLLIDRIFFAQAGNNHEGTAKSLWRSYLLAGGSAIVATLLNPAGAALWQNSFGYLGNRFLVDMTIEYRSPDFHIVSAQPFLFLIGLLVMLLGLQRQKVPAAHLVTTGAWLVMGLYSARNIPLFAIVSAPVLAILLRGWLDYFSARWFRVQNVRQLDHGLQKLDAASPALVYPLLAVFFVTQLFGAGKTAHSTADVTFDANLFPVAAASWLEANPQSGNMFNEFGWGGYLLYRQYPHARVFIDGQTDFYGEALTRQYLQVKDSADGWEGVLAAFQVRWVIIPTSDVLARTLDAHPGWQKVYQDSTAVIFTQE